MSERGDIILGGLLKTVAGVLLGALMAFEIGAVVVNHVQLDDRARGAARAAAVAWHEIGREEAVQTAAFAEASTLQGASVIGIDIGDRSATVTVRRAAPVLVTDRIWFLRDHLVADATASARYVR